MGAATLSAWLLGIMVSTTPPGKARFPKDALEPENEGRARYAAIAEALANVALDPNEKPLFAGAHGRERTAALLLSIAHQESGWRRDVDLGIGPHAHGGGPYHCLMQIRVESGKKNADGWTGSELIGDRTRCFKAALHLLQHAREACKKQGANAWLRAYTAGDCTRGRAAAEKRMSEYETWMARYRLPAMDSVVPVRSTGGSGPKKTQSAR